MNALTLPEPIATVRAKAAGNFPGSPIELSHRLRLEQGLVASLETTA